MPVAAAVVGAGSIADTHITGVQRSPRGALVAVCDRDSERAGAAADEYGIRGYDDVDELLDGEDLDVVHVCTPVQTHLSIARRAIAAGVGVLLEKPATESVADLETLRALAERRQVPASVVHQSLFSPAMRRARELLADGRIGTVRGVDLVYTGAPRPDAAGRGDWVFDLDGGEFEETLPHPLYLGLSGGRPRSERDVTATTVLTSGYDREFSYDAAQVQFVTETGGLSNIKVLAGGHSTRLLHFHGEDGAITVDFATQAVVHSDRPKVGSPLQRLLNSLNESVTKLSALARLAGLVARRELSNDWETEKRLNPHFYQIDETYRAIKTGSDLPVPLEEARWTIALMEEIRAEAGR